MNMKIFKKCLIIISCIIPLLIIFSCTNNSGDSDFKYNKDDTYNVLYINQSDKNIYEYRKLLVKNKIKSLIIYAGNITQRDEEQSIREKLNIPNNTYDNLPILIKMKNKEIINSYNNISLNDLVKNCKQ